MWQIKYCNSYTSSNRAKKQAIGWTWMRLAAHMKVHRSLNISCHSSFQWRNRQFPKVELTPIDEYQMSEWPFDMYKTLRQITPKTYTSKMKKHLHHIKLSTSIVTAVHSKRDSPKSSTLPCPTWFKASNHTKKTS